MKIITHKVLQLQDDILDQVVYRGEGNSSIVIALKNQNQVIKLSKRHKKQCDARQLQTLLKASIDNVIYIDHVFRPLTDRYLSAGFKLVHLKNDFIKNLDDIIGRDRPFQRLEKTLIYHDQYAMLMNDLCLLPKFLTNNLKSEHLLGPIISVEIKPKQGFLPIFQNSATISNSVNNKNNNNRLDDFSINNNHHINNNSTISWSPANSCLYGCNQYLKLARGQITNIGGYCPLNLFSGCPTRMKMAIKELILNPQNNFRVFKDLNLVYDEEKNDKLTNVIEGSFKSYDEQQQEEKSSKSRFEAEKTTSPSIRSSSSNDNNDDSINVEERFIELLCSCLLSRNDHDDKRHIKHNPIMEEDENSFKTCDICLDHSMSSLSIKCTGCDTGTTKFSQTHGQKVIGTKKHENTNYNHQNDKISIDQNIINNRNVTTNLRKRHQLPKSSVLYHVLMAQKLDNIGIHKADSMLDWLLQNNDSENLFARLTSSRQPSGFKSPHQLANETKNDYYIRKVWEFLVSMTAKDCSMMVTFQRITRECRNYILQNKPELERYLLSERATGCYFLYSIGLTDLDKKKPMKIPIIRHNVDISHQLRMQQEFMKAEQNQSNV